MHFLTVPSTETRILAAIQFQLLAFINCLASEGGKPEVLTGHILFFQYYSPLKEARLPREVMGVEQGKYKFGVFHTESKEALQNISRSGKNIGASLKGW